MKYLFLVAVSWSFFAHANDSVESCQAKRQFSIEYSRCLDQQIENVSRELTTWENNHILQLQEIANRSGRKDPLQVFKKSRQSFKTYSTEHCRWQYLALVPDSQAGAALYKECLLDLYKKEVDTLSKISY